MKRWIVSAALTAAVGLTTAAIGTALAQDNARPLDPIVVSWDKGPDTIDVSKYPPEMKKRYKTFADLCARCHTLARAVNCDFALEDDWERYIKKMMRRGRGLITPQQGLEIFEFAVYDAKVRKKDLYERKLADSRR
jgi:hypothetical protein